VIGRRRKPAGPRRRAVAAVLAALAAPPSGGAAAQDLVITDARIVDGTGRVIERGSVVVEGGRIVAVTGEPVEPGGAAAIDARGLTALPGLIDTHRHDLLSSLEDFHRLASDADVAAAVEHETPRRLRTLLGEGFTTVMMPGMFLEAGLEVRRRLEQGELEGPRLLLSGPGFCAPGDFPAQGFVCQGNLYCMDRVAVQITDPDAACAEVRRLAGAGIDAVKVFVDGVGLELDDAVLAAVAGEAREAGLRTMLHAHRVEDVLDGVRLGADRLVHVPGDAAIADGPGARALRDRGVAVATTVSFSSPQWAEAVGLEYTGAERHRRMLRNIRHLVDEGVVVAFGTDSPDGVRPIVEIEQLRLVLEPEEILATLTRDAARFLDLGDEIGTLEAGKAADVVLVDGDPLADVTRLTRVRVVIRAGRVVVDHR
jgi:imidazolonepropionase-like amidohydrolase